MADALVTDLSFVDTRTSSVGPSKDKTTQEPTARILTPHVCSSRRCEVEREKVNRQRCQSNSNTYPGGRNPD